MPYDELVKLLRSEVCVPYTTMHTMLQAADAIEDLENKLNLWRQDKISRWIPVTKQLPQWEVLGDIYLCYHVSGKHGQTAWIDINWWDGEKFVFKKDGKHDHITHWMPLPEPPKEDKP